MGQRLIILDRDGIINVQLDGGFVRSPDEWQPIPGALESIARLNHAGWHVVVASNQSGIGRGMIDMSTLNLVHQRMHSALATVGGRIDAVFFCPHAPEDKCECRKPKTGLFTQIKERYKLPSLQGVPSLGDSLRDMLASAEAGCEPHLILTGNAERYRSEALDLAFPSGTRCHLNLGAFAGHWLDQHSNAD